ncbi:TadE/TadG family type IV pilus assembly protein [Yoonia maritima]|uniref:TadE/TadG family type IV pilus assembly protein n=1 Tax=Yoonia maritima TaxID=1435347 RepID=UPI000D10F93A|nr:TadE/TadG family type IV pilus assembly protein [Yoonia maritima]
MIRHIASLTSRFRRDDTGTVTIEFVIIFPVFFAFFLMTYESGIISLRQFMLDRGVDIAIRDVRIGIMEAPSDDALRQRICDVASIIPDCDNQLFVELVVQDPEQNWTALTGKTLCINRDEDARPASSIQHGVKNELVLVRACARIDPVLPFSAIGRREVPNIGQAIVDNADAAAGGSYALVSTSSYVVEPQ